MHIAQFKSQLQQNLTPRLAFIAATAALATFSQGYDNGWWGFILAVPQFNAVFGTSVNGAAPKLSIVQIGVGTAITNIGTIISSPFAAKIATRYGRVTCFYSYAVLTIIGSIIQITCGINGIRFWQLVAGKAVVGMAIGFCSLIVPLYLAEVAPAAVRGATVNFYSFNTWCGTLVATGMAYAVRQSSGNIVFILPIAVQIVFPAGSILLAFFMPESPRWLIERGRMDDAKAALQSINRGRMGFDLDSEFDRLRVEVVESMGKGTRPWRDCFKGKDAKRTAISVGMLCLLQGQGLGFVASYSNILLAKLTPNYNQIFIAILGALVCLTTISFFTLDNIGRRILLLWGSVVSAICMIGYAAVYTVTPDPQGSLANLGVAFIVIWLVTYTQTWSTVPFTVFSEVPSDSLRAKTLAIAVISSQFVYVIVTLTSPFIEGANGGTFSGKIGYIFGSISIAGFFFTYFLVPELKGRSLEQVDYMFDVGIPVRKMGAYKLDEVPLTAIGSTDETPSAEKDRQLFQERV